MNRPKQTTKWLQKVLAPLIAITVVGGLMSTLCSAQPASGAPSSQTNTPTTDSAAAPAGITGAELYSIHCNRCHPERYPTERTAANWKTINLHMQIRANIPPAQARLILKYLQDNSGR